MDPRRIDDRLSVADLRVAREQDFRSIVCNRPDGEGPDQPSFAAIKREAGELGLEERHLPVVPGQVNDAQVAKFAEALRELPGPVLAYRRTGTRSTTLWALSQAGRRPVPELLGIA